MIVNKIMETKQCAKCKRVLLSLYIKVNHKVGRFFLSVYSQLAEQLAA